MKPMPINMIPVIKLVTIIVKYTFALYTALSVMIVENPFDKSIFSMPLHFIDGINMWIALLASPVHRPAIIITNPALTGFPVLAYVMIEIINNIPIRTYVDMTNDICQYSMSW